MTNWWKRAAIGGAMVAGLAFGSASLAATPDTWITTKIKLSLLTTGGVSSTDVNVDTIDGYVTLHGTVDSETEKTRAEQAARGVEGVRNVRNMLQVVKPSRQEAVGLADNEIKQNVEDALANDKSLADSSIKVASVNAGVVVLNGTAASLTDHLGVVEDARAVKGVKQVASEIKSPDALSDSEIWRDTQKTTAGDAPVTTTGAMSDMWITTAAKVRLIANADTPATSINVDTQRGVVTLFGTVPNDAAKHAAEAEVAKVDGVAKVRNQLQVVAPPMQEAVAEKDDQIKDRIAKRVDDALTDGSNVTIDVQNGVVRLTGKVERQADRISALTIARSTQGVRSVVDDLQISQ